MCQTKDPILAGQHEIEQLKRPPLTHTHTHTPFVTHPFNSGTICVPTRRFRETARNNVIMMLHQSGIRNETNKDRKPTPFVRSRRLLSKCSIITNMIALSSHVDDAIWFNRIPQSVPNYLGHSICILFQSFKNLKYGIPSKEPEFLQDTSPFFPGILLFRKPSEPQGEKLVLEKNND